MTNPLVYYAVVGVDGDYLRDWTRDSAPIVRYLYGHHQAKLLICHESPDDQTDCSVVATIEPQLTLEAIGLMAPRPSAAGSRLIAVLDALLGAQLDRGAAHYGAAHAMRLGYLTLYLAALKPLAPRDVNLLLLAAYLHDFGQDPLDNSADDGLSRFSRYLTDRGRIDLGQLHATFAAILASIGQPWSRSDTDRLIQVLAASGVSGRTKQLRGWAADIRQLDAIRLGSPADLSRLHDDDAMRLLYASRQELTLIPDHTPKEHS
ncbi:hypothetical protein [Lacticaseibacillus kribbianus]|uniref:hypothetical protein n=1 Tax=Lacticaseibacillus kribbianus TaxID=2926292 RepID=UPI001CD26A9D|nr:hypothetical protein [Lacticaseibacillus kribbianus]